jgi:hypothetical protein
MNILIFIEFLWKNHVLQFVLSRLLFSSFGWSVSLPTGSVLLSLTTRPCFEAEISTLALKLLVRVCFFFAASFSHSL